VLTTSRADYSHLYWVLHELRTHADIDLHTIVLGAPLAEEFGRTVQEMEADGFPVDERIECLLSSDSDVGMAKTIGLATLGLAERLSQRRPDLMLLVADRYEILAPASVALAFRIPLAHIEGGEVSEGAIDDATRNALTKLSHLHFTPTERARRRVIAMGEEPWRVHRTGAPSLDHLRRSVLLDRAALAARLDFDVTDATVVVAYHPVTLADDTLFEADALFAALQRIDAPVVFCFPNADAGGRRLAERAKSFCDARQRATLFVNLNPVVYWSLLSHCGLMVGNSSSGIMETPALKLPTVNVGMRQQGRERAPNVLDAPADGDAITMAIERARSASFRESLSGMENPYGDGDAAPRIVRVLAEVELDRLLMKKATSVD